MPTPNPAAPRNVPADLTRPSRSYRTRAWLAMGVLAAFVLLYLYLSGWFAWTAWRLFYSISQGGSDSFWGIIAGIVAAFLAAFMLKALFFVKRRDKSNDVEITAVEQPRLFAFLNQLADDAKAPRPHRVFLSPRVNAAVFYDLSILNLLWPSRKNLELGMGLVNVLSIGEFRAVCAHEFGHFAQRSMAVGRWVYIAQQIAGNIVARRDALDNFLEGLSHADIRMAWVGWLLRLIIWSLRSLLDTAFSAVVLAQRSLSREMEMQADLVAVSLTGSDALIHALHQLQVADDAWDRTLNFLGGELSNKRIPNDAFALQSRIITRMGELLNIENYGKVPACPSGNPAEHRLFKAEIAQPPRMWLTHPLSHEREENAKRIYIPAEGDPRSAWKLFDNPDEIRLKITARLYNNPEGEAVPSEDSIARLDEQFSREYLNRAYRGVYYGRSPVRATPSVAALYENESGTAAQLDQLYPESLSADLEQIASLEKEQGLLQSIQDGHLKTPGDRVRHREHDIRKRELPAAIAGISAELDAIQARISAHDRLCRCAHSDAAAHLGQGWQAYLKGLAAALHYADHVEANLQDCRRSLSNTIALATATRRVSDADRKRVVAEAASLYSPLRQFFSQRGDILPDSRLLAKLQIESWAETVGELGLNAPHEGNIGDWLNVYDGWFTHATEWAGALKRAALNELLQCESRVAAWYRAGATEETAPDPTIIKTNYPVLLPGQERKLQKRLDWWGRFQTGDGVLPTVARLGAALSIVGVVFLAGNSLGDIKVVIFNGLDRPVSVSIAEQTLKLPPHIDQTITLTPRNGYSVVTKTLEGQIIEQFDVDLSCSFATNIYNVAGAAPLIEFTASYGYAARIPPRALGAPRWSTTTLNLIFTDPPKSISSSNGGGTRTALLTAPPGTEPDVVLGQLDDASHGAAVIQAHARWDDAHSHYILQWLALLSENQRAPVLKARQQDAPLETIALRFAQDSTDDPVAHAQVCKEQTELARAHPDNGDLQYLTVRCIDNVRAKNQAFIEGFAKWPDNAWMAYAAGYSHAEDKHWKDALRALEKARTSDRAMASVVAIDIVRIQRLLRPDTMATAELLEDAPLLQTLQDAERATNLENYDDSFGAWAALSQGELERALQLAHDRPFDASIQRLVGASEGASDKMVRDALKLPADQGIDDNTLPFALALAQRERTDSSAYITALRKSNKEEADTQLRFLELVKAGKIAAADATLTGLHPQTLGRTWAMGVVILGKKAPPAWRDGAQRLLFATERPWSAARAQR